MGMHRREDWREIAHYANKHGVKKAAERYGTTKAPVYKYMRDMDMSTPGMRYPDRCGEIASFAARSGVAAAVEKFGVSTTTVYGYLRRFNLRAAVGENKGVPSPNSFKILREVMGGMPCSEVGERNGVSGQRVESIIKNARQGGFDV